MSAGPAGGASESGTLTLGQFHVALVLPAGTAVAAMDRLYGEVLQPLAAVLRHEQLRTQYVARQVETILHVQEAAADPRRSAVSAAPESDQGHASLGSFMSTLPFPRTTQIKAGPWWSRLTRLGARICRQRR
jgi:hypothetical protein